MLSVKNTMVRFFSCLSLFCILILAGTSPVSAAKYGFRVPHTTLYVGESEKITTYGYDGPVYYYSGNTNCFTVDANGIIRATGQSVSTGITLRVYTKGNKQSSSLKIVTKKPFMTGPSKLSLNKTGTLVFNSNLQEKVIWTSSNPNVVKIVSCSSPKQQKCNIKALKSGSSTLSAKYFGKTYTFKVTVPAPKPTATPTPTPKPTPKPAQTFSVSPKTASPKRVACLLLTVSAKGSFNVTTNPSTVASARFGDKRSNTVYPAYVIGNQNGKVSVDFKHNKTGARTSATVTFTGMDLSPESCRTIVKQQIQARTTPKLLNQSYGEYTCSSQIDYKKDKFVFKSDVKSKAITGKITLTMNKGFTNGTLKFDGNYLKSGGSFKTTMSIVPGTFERNDKLPCQIKDNDTGLSKTKLKNYTNSAKDAAFFMWNLILANDHTLDLKGIGFAKYNAVYK